MSEKATILISEIKKAKVGENSRGPWAFWLVIDGNEEGYGLLSPRDKELLEKVKEIGAGNHADIEFDVDGKRKTLTAAEKAKSNGEEPRKGTGEYVVGQKPQIEARRIFSSTAWNCAVKLVEVEFKMMPMAQEITPARVWEAAKKHADAIFLDLTRKGDAIRDEDIPFEGGSSDGPG